MAVAVTLPDLGARHEPIRVSTWLVDIGDHVHEGDRVVEVLMRGISFDVSAPATGVLTGIKTFSDRKVQPHDVLAWIEPDPESEDEP